MNEIFVALGIESWKPVLSLLVMPPVPFLLIIPVGARLMFSRRLLAWLLVLLGTVGTWLSGCIGMGIVLEQWLIMPPRALTAAEIGELRRAPKTTIVVLGGGRRLLAPEYGVSDLKPMSLERLRYGAWLARETGLPLGFSGGVGHGSPAGPSEGEIASRVAERDFGRPLRWIETTSRDTHENALRTLGLLRPMGVERIVLVTHGYHMPRAQRAFQRAAEREGLALQVVPAPMGLGPARVAGFVNWVPTDDGFQQVRLVVHEWLGRIAGA